MKDALFSIRFGVEVFDKGHSDHSIRRFSAIGEELKVLEDLVVSYPSIGFVDSRIHVLDVNNPVVHIIEERQEAICGHVERGLDVDFPFCATEFAEVEDEIGIEQGFSSAKGHASARGQEIEVVRTKVLVQQLGRVVLPFRFVEAEGFVDTIATSKRACPETNKRHDAIAIHVDSVTANGEDRCVTSVRFHIISNPAAKLLLFFELYKFLTYSAVFWACPRMG